MTDFSTCIFDGDIKLQLIRLFLLEKLSYPMTAFVISAICKSSCFHIWEQERQVHVVCLPYFFGYKTDFFPSKTIPKI